MSSWISVKDRMPPTYCIVQTVTGHVTSAVRYESGWLIDGILRTPDYITHWQPLPAPLPPEPPSLARRVKEEMDRRGLCIGVPRVEEIIELVDKERAREARVTAKHLAHLAHAAINLDFYGCRTESENVRKIIDLLRPEVA